MTGAYSDGAPSMVVPPQAGGSGPSASTFTEKLTRRVNSSVSRVTQFEGKRGRSARAALTMKWTSYFFIALLCAGLTEALTLGIPYAEHGGLFMLGSTVVIAATGAGATFFYVNLRNEIIEKVRHYLFGIVLIPGVLLAGVVRVIQQWEWTHVGTIGSTLQMALPIVFLATVVLPMFIFVKEMLGIRTLHRSKLDDEEAVHLWTRQDGLQR